MGTLTFQPLIPLALWGGLAVAAIGLLTWYGLTSRLRVPRGKWAGIVGLMALLVALPMVLLLNPQWLETLPPPEGKPVLTVLIDTTASMATLDAEGGRSRYAAAVEIAELAAELNADFEVRFVSVDDLPQDIDLENLREISPEALQTDLALALQDALGEDLPAGHAIWVVSDGIHNQAGGSGPVVAAAQKAEAMAVPIYATTLGGASEVRNLELALSSSQEVTFVGQQIPLSLSLSQQGYAGRRVAVHLELEGEELAVEEAVLPPTGEAEVQFAIEQEAQGLYRYDLWVEPLEEEVTTIDNRATLLVRVVDEPIRILLLEGKPYWDSKFLLRTLAADPSVELVSIVRMAEGRLLRRELSRPGEPGFDAPAADPPVGEGVELEVAFTPEEEEANATAPAALRHESFEIITDAARVLGSPQELSAYQVIVLGRDAEVFLDEEGLTNLRGWIARDGGSLVCARGAPASEINQRLGTLMPVRWSNLGETRFRVALTEEGRKLRWFSGGTGEGLAGLPSLASPNRQEETKPLSVVLAASSDGTGGDVRPVISYRQYGAGRVVVVEGAGMWRWALLPPQFDEQGQAYSMLWQSLVRWLMSRLGLLPGQEYAVQSDKVLFTSGENATATLIMRDENASDPPAIELVGDTLETPQPVSPTPLGDAPGVFQLALGNLPEGQYALRLAGEENAEGPTLAAFDVRSPWIERLELDARPDLMEEIAEQSGGLALTGENHEEILEHFQEHLSRSQPPRVQENSAWDRWWVLVAIFGCWGRAWALRRRTGLI